MIFVDADISKFEFHLGDGVPMINPNLIISIEADGEELEAIKREFGLSIPWPKNALKPIWYNDMAATILYNLARIYDQTGSADIIPLKHKKA